MLKIILFTIAFLILQTPAYGWWFGTPSQLSLDQAVKSDQPEKVEKCLDRQIEKRNLMGVRRLQHHARLMMYKERGRMSRDPNATPAVITKGLEPWRKIERKADTFLRKRNMLPETGQHTDN